VLEQDEQIRWQSANLFCARCMRKCTVGSRLMTVRTNLCIHVFDISTVVITTNLRPEVTFPHTTQRLPPEVITNFKLLRQASFLTSWVISFKGQGSNDLYCLFCVSLIVVKIARLQPKLNIHVQRGMRTPICSILELVT